MVGLFLFHSHKRDLKMILREYQELAVESIYSEFRDDAQSALVVIPTGGGKTPIIARLAKDLASHGGRMVIIAHVKELLIQAVEKIRATDPDLDVGIYSAGLGAKDTGNQILVAGIQSVYNQASRLGKRDLVVIDECHRIPEDSNTRYRIFISELMLENPDLKVCGLTATPYRMDDGPIYGDGQLFDKICFEAKIPDLISNGYLSPLRNKAGANSAMPNLKGVHSRGGDFIASELDAAVNKDLLVEAFVRDILEKAKDRKSVLIFAVSIPHAENIWQKLSHLGEVAAIITGDSPSPERAVMIQQFKDGTIRFLVNVMVLTEGFDAPAIDCVALARPTQSAGLYYQMVGRGFRLASGKNDCLILDYGGNIQRHGPIDQIVGKSNGGKAETFVAKECPKCGEIVQVGVMKCPDCGHEWPPREQSSPETKPDEESPILAGLISVNQKVVKDIFYSCHTKAGSDGTAPRTLKVTYHMGIANEISEWICIEHSGWARERAEKWWKKRSFAPCPDSVDEAIQLCDSGAVARALEIETVKKPEKKFPEIVKYKLEPIPKWKPDLVVKEAVAIGEDLPF
jgi:DNA repair protein RadD